MIQEYRIKKALLLVKDDWFHPVCDALLRQGWIVANDFKTVKTFDLLIMDSFFDNSGISDYLRSAKPDMQTILLARGYGETTDGSFRIDTSKGAAHVVSSIEEFVSGFSASPINDFPTEFGSGLWVELTQRLNGLATEII